MNTTKTGRDAEAYVAEQLAKEGYVIKDQNWRTRHCEIDLVMERRKTIYFIEVKYRTSSVYGAGLEYITPKKQQQMRFAAEMWMSNHSWKGNARICAVEVEGALGKPVELLFVD